MCTNNSECSNSEKNELNVKISKQQAKCTSNLDASDHTSVDFHIHTNIELMKNKKMKICLLINIVISIVCVTSCMIILYKVYNELLDVQSEMVRLNGRVELLTKRCEHEHKVASLAESEAQALSGITETEESLIRLRDGASASASAGNKGNGDGKDGTLAAHFKGSIPEVFLKDQGLIGPWYLDNSISKQYKFTKFHLTESHCSIEVTEPALYLIYAQVYYVTSNILNSYSVVVRSEGSSENNIIARCSAVGPKSHLAELSCYTATVYSLKANDRVFLQQTEKNRTVILRDGHSFFGMIRLNNSHSHRL